MQLQLVHKPRPCSESESEEEELQPLNLNEQLGGRSPRRVGTTDHGFSPITSLHEFRMVFFLQHDRNILEVIMMKQEQGTKTVESDFPMS